MSRSRYYEPHPTRARKREAREWRRRRDDERTGYRRVRVYGDRTYKFARMVLRGLRKPRVKVGRWSRQSIPADHLNPDMTDPGNASIVRAYFDSYARTLRMQRFEAWRARRRGAPVRPQAPGVGVTNPTPP